MRERLIGGIPVTVYGLEELTNSSTGCAVLFVLHGRFGNRADPPITRLINAARAKAAAGKGRGKELLIVSLDQRNHGERLFSKDRVRALVTRRCATLMLRRIEAGKTISRQFNPSPSNPTPPSSTTRPTRPTCIPSKSYVLTEAHGDSARFELIRRNKGNDEGCFFLD